MRSHITIIYIKNTYTQMFWFLLHHMFQQAFTMSDQTRNLTTFILGTLIHTIVYSYLGSLNLTANPFLKTFHGFYSHILLADAISIAIIYKNYYNASIITEINGLFSNGKAPVNNDELSVHNNDATEE